MENKDIIERIRVYLKNDGIVLPKKPIQEFYAQIFKLSGFGIGGIISLSGKKAGTIGAKIIKDMIEDESELNNIEKIFDYARIFLHETNICELENWNISNEEINFTAKGSIFAEAIGNSKKPACIPLSSAIAGLFEELTGNKWKCIESKCMAQGNEVCEFKITTK